MGKYSKLNKLYGSESILSKVSRANISLDHVNPASLDGLNEQQVGMVTGIQQYVAGKLDLPYFTVQGIGGSGKTFSIKRAIEHIPTDEIIFAAPSHAAKNVLSEFLGSTYEVITVAKLLGMIMDTDRSTGAPILIKNRKIRIPPIARANIIVIDEVSMIDDETAKLILSYNTKVILMGDYGQLPPVGQSTDSLFFNVISAELNIPMRFTGHIFDLTSAVRVEIDAIRADEGAHIQVINRFSNRESKLDDFGNGYVFSKDTRKFLSLALKLFGKHKGRDYVRIIAYRNKTIDMVNKTIRLGLYGMTADKYVPGEIVICNGGFTKKMTTEEGNSIVRTVLTNGEVLTIESVKKVLGFENMPCMEIRFVEKSHEDYVTVVDDPGLTAYGNIVKRLIKIAKSEPAYWKKLKEFKEEFAYLDYAYAVSSHKAQGATIKHTFVMEEDILTVKPTTLKEKLQSLYVSLSRASFRLYVLNNKFNVNQKNLDVDNFNKDFDHDI